MAEDKPLSRIVSGGRYQFHVLDWGGSGQPLVFLHGLASSSHMFDLIAPAFTSTYHVFAVDQRGHGLSDKPSSGYDFETIAADLDGVCVSLDIGGLPLTLVGHSWGAYTALYYAATRGGKTRRLVLIDGGLRPIRDFYPTWEAAEIGMKPPVYHNRSEADIRRMIREDWLGSAFRPELEPLALSIFDTSNPSDVRAHLALQNHMQIAYALWDFNPGEYLASVACPTLIINAIAPGEAVDPQLQRYAEDAQNQNSMIQVIWMHDSIHDIPWHRPRELIEIIRD